MKDWMREMLRGIGDWDSCGRRTIKVEEITLPVPALQAEDIRNGASQDNKANYLYRQLEELTYQGSSDLAAVKYVQLAHRFSEIGDMVVQRQFFSALHDVTLGQVYAECCLVLAIRDYGSQYPDVNIALSNIIKNVLKSSTNGHVDEKLQKCGLALLIHVLNDNSSSNRDLLLSQIKKYVSTCTNKDVQYFKVNTLESQANTILMTRVLITWMGFPSKSRSLKRQLELTKLPSRESVCRDDVCEDQMAAFNLMISQFNLRIAVNAVVVRHATRNGEKIHYISKSASLCEKESIARQIIKTSESKQNRALTMTRAALKLLTKQQSYHGEAFGK